MIRLPQMQELNDSDAIGSYIGLLHSVYLRSDFILGISNKIGATLMGVKPAELLNIPVYMEDRFKTDWMAYRDFLKKYTRISMREIGVLNGRMQVLIYHQDVLHNTLSSKVVLRFLRNLGYPLDYDLDTYLEHIIGRLQASLVSKDEKVFPHEVGVFLGYPLKDVMGYIGHPLLKLAYIKGWNYYGAVRPSMRRYEAFMAARNYVRELIRR